MKEISFAYLGVVLPLPRKALELRLALLVSHGPVQTGEAVPGCY